MEKRLITVSLEEVKPYENNPRKNDKAVGPVAESIFQTGYNNPIIVDEDMIILAGHTRLKSLKKLGEKTVQVLQVEGLTKEQKKKFRLLDNKAGEYSGWDYVALMEEMVGLDWEGLELDWGLNGYEDEQDMEDEPEEDEGTEPDGKMCKCPDCGYIFKV